MKSDLVLVAKPDAICRAGLHIAGCDVHARAVEIYRVEVSVVIERAAALLLREVVETSEVVVTIALDVVDP